MDKSLENKVETAIKRFAELEGQVPVQQREIIKSERLISMKRNNWLKRL
jgi:hypothetical protein